MVRDNVGRRPSGALEANVLSALWHADGPLSAGEIREALGAGLARTTVATILARMHEKGVITRTRSGRGYAYLPAADAAGLTARRMHAELNRDEDREGVLARFVTDLSAEDEQTLRALLDADDREDPPGDGAP